MLCTNYHIYYSLYPFIANQMGTDVVSSKDHGRTDAAIEKKFTNEWLKCGWEFFQFTNTTRFNLREIDCYLRMRWDIYQCNTSYTDTIKAHVSGTTYLAEVSMFRILFISVAEVTYPSCEWWWTALMTA